MTGCLRAALAAFVGAPIAPSVGAAPSRASSSNHRGRRRPGGRRLGRLAGWPSPPAPGDAESTLTAHRQCGGVPRRHFSAWSIGEGLQSPPARRRARLPRIALTVLPRFPVRRPGTALLAALRRGAHLPCAGPVGPPRCSRQASTEHAFALFSIATGPHPGALLRPDLDAPRTRGVDHRHRVRGRRPDGAGLAVCPLARRAATPSSGPT
jgi:hypothetical protein